MGVLWLSFMLSHLLEGDVLVTYGYAMQGPRGQKKKAFLVKQPSKSMMLRTGLK